MKHKVFYYYGRPYVNNSVTQGFKKNFAYALAVFKSEKFINEVSNLRRKYKIPTALLDKNGKRLNRKLKTTNYEAWLSYTDDKSRRLLSNDVDSLMKLYGLHLVDWEDTFNSIIFENKIIPPLKNQNLGDLCLLANMVEESVEPFSARIRKADLDIFPIAIRISPYASKRDIIDYVTVIFPMIKWMQEKFKKNEIKIGKIRSKRKDKEKLYDYVYKLRKFHLRTIGDRVNAKFGLALDEGHIGKILSVEAKRRKKV